MAEPPPPRAAGRLFLTSASVLYAELLLLRWIPAMVTYVGFFSNFLLIGCFIGMGCGILLGRRSWRTTVSPFAVLLGAVVLLVSRSALSFQMHVDDEIFFGLRDSHVADVNFLVLPALIVLVTAVMAALSLPLGPLLRALPPLKAYAVDIAGSLAGIAAFTTLSISGAPPIAWFSGLFALLGIAWFLGERRIGAGSLVNVAAFAAVLFLARQPAVPGALEIWSPYYRITALLDGPLRWINVNGIPHQSMWPVTRIIGNASPYEQIYGMFPGRHYEKVLIVGAGSGTDVALACHEGAGHIDAVEIDPEIADLGARFHPDRPYDDKRVDLHIDDGRSYLGKSQDRYDLIIFALPDSLTLASASAHVRLESFLFTRESFERAKEHLAPHGLFVLYNFYRERWLIDRIGGMLRQTFGRAPQVRIRADALAVLVAGEDVAPGPTLSADADADAPTDDHPFLYLRHRAIPGVYLGALAAVIVFAAASVGISGRVAGVKLGTLSPHFFALGAAFMLLETRSLVTFSLLFGTTWLVNSLAFFAILTSVLLAVFVNNWVRIAPRYLYIALAVTLVAAWAIAPEKLLIEPRSLRYLLASGLAFAPIFVANLVFTHSFRDSAAADVAFASNLVGAACGGALEYAALVTGHGALALIALALYGLAWAAYRLESPASPAAAFPAAAAPIERSS